MTLWEEVIGTVFSSFRNCYSDKTVMTLVSLLAQLEDCSKMANSLPFAAIKS